MLSHWRYVNLQCCLLASWLIWLAPCLYATILLYTLCKRQQISTKWCSTFNIPSPEIPICSKKAYIRCSSFEQAELTILSCIDEGHSHDDVSSRYFMEFVGEDTYCWFIFVYDYVRVSWRLHHSISFLQFGAILRLYFGDDWFWLFFSGCFLIRYSFENVL